jgi:hypothetical protein
MLRLLLDADSLAILIELYNAVSSWVSYVVAKDSCAALSGCNLSKKLRKALIPASIRVDSG